MASTPPCRIVVMASGSGSNFQALLDGVASGRIANAQIVRLFVNRKTAYAVTRAERSGVPSEYFNMVAGGFQAKGEKDTTRLKEARTRYDAALAEKVLAEKPDLVVLAGWMHVFTEGFLRPVAERGVKVINLHPALPGELLELHCLTLSALVIAVAVMLTWAGAHFQASTTEPAPSSERTRTSRRAS